MVLLEGHANVLALGVLEGILVVSNVSGLSGKDAVIATKFAILAGEPVCSALAEDDVTRDYVLSCASLSAKCTDPVSRNSRAYLRSFSLLIAFLARPWRRWLVLGLDVRNVLRKTGWERVRRRHWQCAEHR